MDDISHYLCFIQYLLNKSTCLPIRRLVGMRCRGADVRE